MLSCLLHGVSYSSAALSKQCNSSWGTRSCWTVLRAVRLRFIVNSIVTVLHTCVHAIWEIAILYSMNFWNDDNFTNIDNLSVQNKSRRAFDRHEHRKCSSLIIPAGAFAKSGFVQKNTNEASNTHRQKRTDEKGIKTTKENTEINKK